MAEDTKRHPGGRPPKYDDPTSMQSKIDEYFANCPDKRTLYDKDGNAYEINAPTISGLALFLGFVNRQSMYAYEQKIEFSDTIKIARAKMERIYEQYLLNPYPTGAIFALKNFGWTDKQEISGGYTIEVVHREIRQLITEAPAPQLTQGQCVEAEVVEVRQGTESQIAEPRVDNEK